MGMSQMK